MFHFLIVPSEAPVSTLYSYFSITLSKISNTYSLKEERLIKAQHFRVVHPIIDQ